RSDRRAGPGPPLAARAGRARRRRPRARRRRGARARARGRRRGAPARPARRLRRAARPRRGLRAAQRERGLRRRCARGDGRRRASVRLPRRRPARGRRRGRRRAGPVLRRRRARRRRGGGRRRSRDPRRDGQGGARARRARVRPRGGGDALRKLLPARAREPEPGRYPMMRLAITCLLLATLAGSSSAQTELSAGALAHQVDRLATTGRVLYVAAHPDDENTRLLSYLANVRHLDVGYLSMTRGGGGQNLIGGEQGILLDVIRTEELVAARRIDGARQFFTRMRDFGYSKRADETVAVWGHDEALADVVWVIRTFQPDVIITRFNELPPNHGHHTASAILAREAFAAAADPKKFPEQLTGGATVWQAERLLYNFANFSGMASTNLPKDAVQLDIGGYDPRLGLEVGELAARSRSQHKSQGFGVPETRGSIVEQFIVLAGKRPTSDPLDGIELGWQRYGAAAAGY